MRVTRLPLVAGAALCLLAGSPASAAPGAPDPRFGDGGWVRMSFGPTDDAAAMVRRADGRLVVAGGVFGFRDARGADGRGGAAVPADGALDLTFGTGGAALVRIASPTYLFDVDALPDGRIVATAQPQPQPQPRHVRRRVTRFGKRDPSVGRGGAAVHGSPARNEALNGAVVAPDGTVVATG